MAFPIAISRAAINEDGLFYGLAGRYWPHLHSTAGAVAVGYSRCD